MGASAPLFISGVPQVEEAGNLFLHMVNVHLCLDYGIYHRNQNSSCNQDCIYNVKKIYTHATHPLAYPRFVLLDLELA